MRTCGYLHKSMLADSSDGYDVHAERFQCILANIGFVIVERVICWRKAFDVPRATQIVLGRG